MAAVVAHWTSGVTCWFGGDYLNARMHLEQALAIYECRAGSRDLQGVGAGPAVRHHEVSCPGALAAWQDRSIAPARRRSGECVREKSGRCLRPMRWFTRRSSTDYAEACCSKQRRSWRSVSRATTRCRCMWPPARYLNGLAKWRAGDRMGGLSEMRRGWTLLHENDCYLCEPFWGMQVAVANAEAGQLETGLEILSELIAWTEQSGQHWLDAELHRARGELLSRLDPSDVSSGRRLPSTEPWKSHEPNRRRLSSCAAPLDLRACTREMAEQAGYPKCSLPCWPNSMWSEIFLKSWKRKSCSSKCIRPVPFSPSLGAGNDSQEFTCTKSRSSG